MHERHGLFRHGFPSALALQQQGNAVWKSAMSDQPTLSQTQVIRALADAITWFEREVSWGVRPSSLQKLTGRIGELYVAMLTNGQMALSATERGYDVISAVGDYISVKTVTSTKQIKFNASTFDRATRVVILRIDDDQEKGVIIQQLLDLPKDEALKKFNPAGKHLSFKVPQNKTASEPLANSNLKVISRAAYGEEEILRYETGAIKIQRHGVEQHMNVKGYLRPIAAKFGISTDNESGSPLNTQQLGARVIQALNDLKG